MQEPTEVNDLYTIFVRTKAGIAYCIAGYQFVAQHVVWEKYTQKKNLFPTFDCEGTITLINKYSFRVAAMRSAFYIAGHFLSFQTVSNSCRGRFSM
jgi:hypothetical protein